ncbi:MAG TPA: DNA topoisomerase IB [Casimicrobiaceae bacterium]
MDSSPSISACVAEAVEVARAAGLVYVRDSEAGIRRLRRNGGFRYLAPDGTRLEEHRTLDRIAALAIPPAYEDVWICVNPRGHLQATGRDARGRKQYRYHAEWRKLRDGAKFERMIEFGDALPRLRRRVRRDLAQSGLQRDKVIAIIVGLLDATRVRIGNAAYARDNSSFGLTTLRNRHARFVRDGRLLLEFRGKGGVPHEVPVDDRRLVRLVRHCQQLPGQQLFQYVDDQGARHAVTSDLVNDYLRDAMGADFTAKDFRTWGASLRAIALLAKTPLPENGSDRACKACITAAIKTVAAELINTPTVCRKSYITPVIFDAWRRGTLHEAVPASAADSARNAERRAIEFLRRETRRTRSKGRTNPPTSSRGFPTPRRVENQSREAARSP